MQQIYLQLTAYKRFRRIRILK